MQRTVEASHNCLRGVFFDLENRAAGSDVVFTGLDVGAPRRAFGVARATLWARAGGPCLGAESTPGAWRVVWKGDLHHRRSTPVRLAEGVVVPTGAKRGLLLHSEAGLVCCSDPGLGAEDGVLRVEPWHWTKSDTPFGSHRDDNKKYTPAGAIHYETWTAARR